MQVLLYVIPRGLGTSKINRGQDIQIHAYNLDDHFRDAMDSFRKQFMASLWEMRGERILTDVTLKLSDDSSVPCHKIILMAASPFFKTMFQSGMKESSGNEVTLDLCSADILMMLLKYIYTDEVNVNADNVQDVTTACNFLCLDDLKAKCEELMSSLLDPSFNHLDYIVYM